MSIKISSLARSFLSAALVSTTLVFSCSGVALAAAGDTALPDAHLSPLTNSASRPSSTLVDVKVFESSGIRLRGGKLVLADSSKPAANLTALQAVLDQYQVKGITRLFKTSEQKLDNDAATLNRSGHKLKNLNTWLTIELSDGRAAQLAAALKSVPAVEAAYAQPAQVAPPTGPNLVPYQLYRSASPTGVDADYAASGTIPGAMGDNVKVADIEYSWNHSHEDISKLALPGGASLTQECTDGMYSDHGTAVASIIVGDQNSFGVTGIAPHSRYMPVSACYSSVAAAIDAARQQMIPGDVLVTEMQTQYYNADGSAGPYLPVEYNQAEYDAISTATAAGIIVIEPAANGGVNLDDSKYAPAFGPSPRASSGAIMVGAAADATAVCGNSYPARSRLPLSNYGSRLDVQNWGACVTAAGYDTVDPSAPVNSAYTYGFSGTSSASAITAGTAADVSSAFKAKNGRPATPQQVAGLLKQYSVPQDTTSVGVLTGAIGPQPDLKRILDAITGGTTVATPPSVPTGLTAAIGGDGSVQLRWNAATDDTGVASYRIMRSGAVLATAPATASSMQTYTDTTAASNTNYSYTVAAVDTDGNASAASAPATVQTPYFADNFASGTLAQWSRSTNMSLISSGTDYAARALSSPTAKRAAFAQKDFTSPQSTLYVKEQIKVNAKNSGNARFVLLRTAANAQLVDVYRTTTGYLAMRNDVTGTIFTSSTPLALGTAYTLQLHVTINGSSSVTEVWLNGTKVAALSKTLNLGTTPIGRLQIGESASTMSFDMTFDNVVVAATQLP